MTLTQSSDQMYNPPPANRETFKDLLRFEERLKQNAERLQRQRIKYEAFLVSIIIVSLVLAYKTFLSISPYKLIHYIYVGLLLVSMTTLILFFATGMYTDQIAYANKFIPQTNRALRPFNMFLVTPSTLTSTTANKSLTPLKGENRLKRVLIFFKKKIGKFFINQKSFLINTSISSNSQFESNPTTHSTPSSSSSSTPTTRPSHLINTDLDDYHSVEDDNKSLGYYPHDHVSIQNLNPRGEILFSTLVDSHFINQYKLYRHQWEIRQKKLNI